MWMFVKTVGLNSHVRLLKSPQTLTIVEPLETRGRHCDFFLQEAKKKHGENLPLSDNDKLLSTTHVCALTHFVLGPQALDNGERGRRRSWQRSILCLGTVRFTGPSTVKGRRALERH